MEKPCSVKRKSYGNIMALLSGSCWQSWEKYSESKKIFIYAFKVYIPILCLSRAKLKFNFLSWESSDLLQKYVLCTLAHKMPGNTDSGHYFLLFLPIQNPFSFKDFV